MLPWINGLMLIAAIPAILGWILVAVTSIQVMFLVPPGQRMAGYNDISMWRFGKLRQRIGPKAEPYFKRMKIGGIAFALGILAVILLVALSIAFQEQAPAAGTAALSEPIYGVSNA